MLNTVVLLIVFVETVIYLFQDSLMNGKFFVTMQNSYPCWLKALISLLKNVLLLSFLNSCVYFGNQNKLTIIHI